MLQEKERKKEKKPTIHLTLVSFAVTRRAYQKITELFCKVYEEETGQPIRFRLSFGGSGTQVPSLHHKGLLNQVTIFTSQGFAISSRGQDAGTLITSQGFAVPSGEQVPGILITSQGLAVPFREQDPGTLIPSQGFPVLCRVPDPGTLLTSRGFAVSSRKVGNSRGNLVDVTRCV